MLASALHLSEQYIDGRWTRSRSHETIAVIDPATEQEIATVPAGTGEDVDRAVAAAKAAFETWSSSPVQERAAVLRKIAAGIVDRGEELALVAAHDIGTPITAGRRSHVTLPATSFTDMANRIERYSFEEPSESLTIVREPVGLVGCITPWNYPGHQIAAKIAPAIAGGCTVVVKPSEVAPLTAYILAEAVAEAGLPPGVFNMVCGSGPVVGESIASHPDIDMISFTGSVRAGTHVAALAAAGVKRVALELGGKSANIVLDDVDDLAPVMASAIASAYVNTGQTCSALTRLLVPEHRLKDVEDLIVAAAELQVVGDPARPETTIGPLVSAAQHDRVTAYIRKGISEGARIITGGAERPIGLYHGFFVSPTVFSSVAPGSVLGQEEIFGPVLAIIAYDDEDDAVAIANNTRYGLSGGVWSADRGRAERVAKRLRTGQVRINGGVFNPVAPFGGYKQSGIGRECGPAGLEEYLEIKALCY